VGVAVAGCRSKNNKDITMAFDEVRFPVAISRGSSGGPERRTEIVTTASGREERNSRWADSKRRYNAGLGVKSLNDIHEVVAFFEERRGRLHAFRWKDHADFRSCAPQNAVAATDQLIGIGDGVTATFQLVKRYGTGLRDMCASFQSRRRTRCDCGERDSRNEFYR
jgi:uncharacterized protein (TIGR02217 family)